jgi:hypothetical protein
VSKENSQNETGETISNERQEEVQDDQEMSEVSEGEETTLLRKVGYFAAFHLPSEIKESVGKIR